MNPPQKKKNNYPPKKEGETYFITPQKIISASTKNKQTDR